MADHAHTVEPHDADVPLTPDAFIADRQQFWYGFTRFVVTMTVSVVVLLILLALFLV
ncbi:MAG: aa3-type cytochrome c oxidase subunit IV [Alphaproteobacteria bacterium]|nr:aa3-type cytochrome c oxidase subunit IV [Alphaproteobacteria bacterium]